MVEMVGRELFRTQKVNQYARVEIAGPRCHYEASSWREAHRGIDSSPVFDCREARTGTQMSQNAPPPGCLRPGKAGQFFHQVFVRDAVETVAPNALRLVAAWNGQRGGNRGDVAMERRIETRNLRHIGPVIRERSDQSEFRREMCRVERFELFQIVKQLRCDDGGRGVI